MGWWRASFFAEVARVLALRGAAVICMPHAGRFKLYPDGTFLQFRDPAVAAMHRFE